MSSIQRTMTRAMAREGFAHKNIARKKEKRDTAIEEQRRRILEYTKSLPEAPAITGAVAISG